MFFFGRTASRTSGAKMTKQAYITPLSGLKMVALRGMVLSSRPALMRKFPSVFIINGMELDSPQTQGPPAK